MSRATHTPGVFVWRELMTPDIRRAKGFYGELFGWRFQEMDMGTFEYPVIRVGGRSLGGLVTLDADAGHPPHWMSYVSVDDVDASVVAAKAAKGSVPVDPMDVPTVGRFAVIRDPDGAHLTVFRAEGGDPPRVERPPLGTFCWETLSTRDADAAKSFYGSVVGWIGGAGPSPDAEMATFATKDGSAVADVQKAARFPPRWTTYVAVESLEDACLRLTGLGGRVVIARIDIPSVGGIGLFADPLGAHLGLFEPLEG